MTIVPVNVIRVRPAAITVVPWSQSRSKGAALDFALAASGAWNIGFEHIVEACDRMRSGEVEAFEKRFGK